MKLSTTFTRTDPQRSRSGGPEPARTSFALGMFPSSALGITPSLRARTFTRTDPVEDSRLSP